MKRLIQYKWTSWLLFIICTSVAQADDKVVLTLPKMEPGKTSAIVWERTQFDVQKKMIQGVLMPVVKLEGLFPRPHWTLIRGKKNLTINAEKRFATEVVLQARLSSLSFQAVSPQGTVETEKIILRYDGWDAFRESGTSTQTVAVAAPQRTNLSMGLGITSSSFQQYRVEDLSETLLTLKMSYAAPLLAPAWDWGVTAFVSVLPLTRSRTDVSARFFGLNARVGYVLPFVKDPWRISLMAGGYYTTMFVSGSPMGYSNVGGPMFFPVIRRQVTPRSSASMYFKFSPVTDGAKMLDFKTREIAFGGAWTQILANGHPASLTFDYADLALYFNDEWLLSRSISLGVSYGF